MGQITMQVIFVVLNGIFVVLNGILVGFLIGKILYSPSKKTLIDFHVEVIKRGLIEEGELKWNDKYEPKVRENAEKYYSEKYKKI